MRHPTSSLFHADLVELMSIESELKADSLRVDGGPTANTYLMQRQSDLINADVLVPQLQELSGMGAACAAGFSSGLYNPDTIYAGIKRRVYSSEMNQDEREMLRKRWQSAVQQVLLST